MFIVKLDFSAIRWSVSDNARSIGIVNGRLEEAVRIEMLMKTATPIVE